MGRRTQTWMVWLMVATAAHLPVPVCDGDNIGSFSPAPQSSLDCQPLIDIDYVLLGCDLPDDPDDGPVDDDPEGNVFFLGACPFFLGSRSETFNEDALMSLNSPLERHAAALGVECLIPALWTHFSDTTCWYDRAGLGLSVVMRC